MGYFRDEFLNYFLIGAEFANFATFLTSQSTSIFLLARQYHNCITTRRSAKMAAALQAVFCVSLFLLCIRGEQFGCFRAPATPQDRRPSNSSFTVATFNAEWLFAGTTHPLQCEGGACHSRSPSDSEKHLNDVGNLFLHSLCLPRSSTTFLTTNENKTCQLKCCEASMRIS